MISKQELFNQFNSGRNQYTYFIMAIDASGIGFALAKVDEKVFTWPLSIFLFAIISWAVSFFAGIRFQQQKNKILLLEYKNMDTREVDYPGIMGDQLLIEAASTKIKVQAGEAQKKIYLSYNLLNLFMILGIIFYVAYQIWEMAIRSNSIK